MGLIKYSSLMGVFPLSNPPPTSHTASINMISNLDKGKLIVGESTYFTPFEEVYNVIQSTCDPSINDHSLVALDYHHLPYWLENPSPYLDYLLHTLPTNKFIIEFMSLDKISLKDHHHRSSFLPPFPYGRRALCLQCFI